MLLTSIPPSSPNLEAHLTRRCTSRSELGHPPLIFITWLYQTCCQSQTGIFSKASVTGKQINDGQMMMCDWLTLHYRGNASLKVFIKYESLRFML